MVMLHVEILHSEDGESPFVVKEDTKDRPSHHLENASTISSARSSSQNPLASRLQDHRYLQCPFQCGERIARAELSTHRDFHVAEEMALEGADTPSQIQLSTIDYGDAEMPEDIASKFITASPKPLRTGDETGHSPRSRSKDKRKPSLKEIFLGSPDSAKRRTSLKSIINDGRTRRLGVSHQLVVDAFAHHILAC